MMKFQFIGLALALVIGSVGGSRAAQDSKPVELFKGLVAAINSRDKAKITAFIQANATGDVPLETRVERMLDLVEQGAPFKIVGAPKLMGDEVKASLVDREGIRLAVTFITTGGTAPKMKALRAMPVRQNDGPDKSLNDWKDLKDLATRITAKRKIPAMGITTIHDGKLESAVTGIREIGKEAEVGADEPWSIGSIGKPICSTIIGLLIEQGKLRWDETLGEALKGIPMEAEYERVTLEQVMQHRGGIPQDLGFNRARVMSIVGDATTPTSIRERYARDILSRAPIGKPGEKMAYSNAGYALLGHIAERATGKPYETLVREMVFAPLSLKNSYTGADKRPEGRPSGHMDGPMGLRPMSMTGPLESMVAPAGGGMFMSTADLAKFGAAHLKGLRGQDGLLKATTVARLHKGLPEGDGSFLYACGWGIEANPGIETFHGHNGSNGTFRAQLAIFPKSNLVVAAIVNSGGESEPSPGLEAALAVAGRWAVAK
jgi:CubicO group peptidase (beta-lactamase class C family)